MSREPGPDKSEGLSRRRFLMSGAATLGAVTAGLPLLGQRASTGSSQENPKSKVLHIIGYSR